MLKTLGWSRPPGHSSQSVLALKDFEGNGILHLACTAAPALKSTTIVALSEAADSLLPPTKPKKDAIVVGKDKMLVTSDATRARDKPLKTGWLSKKKEGNAYRRRWCVLTQDKLSYFQQPRDAVPKGVVPLLGCAFKRVTGPSVEGACFALTSPLIKKPSFFGIAGGSADTAQTMYFQAESESELLQWIAPTR